MLREFGTSTVEAKGRLDQKLIENWVDQLGKTAVSADREPILNRDRLVQLLCQAQEEQQPLVFVAVGCQDWIKPEWGDPNVDFTLGRIPVEGKRPQRFTRELASFSQALSSFEIPHRIHFSLSNIEGLIHIHLQNMGVTIHNPENAEEHLEANVTRLAGQINELAPDAVVPFDHLQLLQQLTQQTDLEQLQQLLAGKSNPRYREFLDRLYAFDLQKTAAHFVKPREVGPVWLDIQSFNFHDDVASMSQAAAIVAPEMPILSIFPNAGNWRAAGAPEMTFPNKKQVIAGLLGVNQVPTTNDQWLNKIHRTRDEVLTSILSDVVNSEIVIEDGQQKTIMARLFFLLAFGFDPTNTEDI